MPELLDGQGRPVALGARLGRGGEGEVFEVRGLPQLAAKVVHAPRQRQGKAEKVKAMVERPPAGAYETIEGFPVLTWPRAALHARDGGAGPTFVGYTMTRVTPRDFVPFFQLTTAARRKDLGGVPITWDRLVLLALRLCHVVRTLHRFGYAIGDLNDRNVLVSRRLTPLLMDTDSFQVPRPGHRGAGHFPSVVGDQLYWPPELLDTDLATYAGSRVGGDRYALGVLLFQLFMDGLRPYQSRGSAVDGLDSLLDKTRAGHYPWTASKPGVLEPPAGAPNYAALPRPIRTAFERCFVAGHAHPGRRPSADEWYDALTKVHAAGFQNCAVEARHVYGRDQGACPWCLDPNDPFDPAPRPARRPSPAAAPTVVKTLRRAGGKARRRPTSAPLRPAAARPRRPKALAGAVPSATLAAQPATVKRAARSKPAKRRPAPRKTRMASRWPARAAWLAALFVLLASPAVALAQTPSGEEKRIVTSAATILLVAALGTAASLRWAAAWPARLASAWLWLTAATAATLALGAVGRWEWLAVATGAACLLAGAAVFVVLERRDGNGFRPTRPGLLHGAVAVPLAYLPVVVLWLWAGA